MHIHNNTSTGKEYILPEANQLYRDPPVLKTPDKGDWYIYYNVWNFKTGKWQPQKYYTTILNKKDIVKNLKERIKHGKIACNVADTMLKRGLNPITGNAISPFENKSAVEILSEESNDSPIPLLKTAIEKWLTIKSGKDNPKKEAPENKENTAYTYKYFFNSFLEYAKEHNYSTTRIDKIPKHFVYQFFEERYNKGIIGDLTWNVQLGYIKGLFSYFSKLYDYQNIIVNISPKEVIEDSERFEPFTEEQIRAILNYLDNPQIIDYQRYKKEIPPNKLLAYTARTILYAFIRISELKRIKIKNVKDYKEGFFTLSTGITKTKKKIFNKLYLEPCLVEEFKKLGWEKYFDDRQYENYYVFTTDMIPSPEKANKYSLGMAFKTVLEKLEIYDENDKKYSLYSLKASGNIIAYNSGWDLFQISLQNRHTTTKQTEIYLRKLKCNIADKPRPERRAF